MANLERNGDNGKSESDRLAFLPPDARKAKITVLCV